MDIGYYGDKLLRIWDFFDHVMVFGEVESHFFVRLVIAPCYRLRDVLWCIVVERFLRRKCAKHHFSTHAAALALVSTLN